MKHDDYEKAVSYIQSIPRFNDDDRFNKAKGFYGYLKSSGVIGDDTGVRIFHVAGTNGKGSVCAFLASIHRAMGKSVGVFTSPHLVDIRERITLNGEMISKEDFALCHRSVCDSLEGYDADYSPVYFDHLFFIAAVYFAMKGTDAVIWETGLGGRLDATNVLPRKSVAVITSIGLDHMELLGDTREKIAYEKAGIIAGRTPVIAVDGDSQVFSVIRKEADLKGAPLKAVPDYKHIKKKMDDKGIDFSYNSIYHNDVILRLEGDTMRAVYQTENATLALAAMESVYDDLELTYDVMAKGASSMSWPGRMELIKPGVIFDGAHNADGIDAFIDSVRADGCRGKRLLLFSAVADKQAETELERILEADLFAMIGLAHIDNARAIDNDRLSGLMHMATSDGVEAALYEDVYSAYDALDEMREENDILYVCGSLYLVGELKAHIGINGD